MLCVLSIVCGIRLLFSLQWRIFAQKLLNFEIPIFQFEKSTDIIHCFLFHHVVQTIFGRETYYLFGDVIYGIRSQASSIGNFAKRLTERLFPERFGPDHLRLQCSYHGGAYKGQRKSKLEPARKAILLKYVAHFYPEVQAPHVLRKVVDAINEGLRRPAERRSSQKAISTHVFTRL